MVNRVWRANGLKPHLCRTFKLSNDRRFVEKLVDVVGLGTDGPVEIIEPDAGETMRFYRLLLAP